MIENIYDFYDLFNVVYMLREWGVFATNFFRWSTKNFYEFINIYILKSVKIENSWWGFTSNCVISLITWRRLIWRFDWGWFSNLLVFRNQAVESTRDYNWILRLRWVFCFATQTFFVISVPWKQSIIALFYSQVAQESITLRKNNKVYHILYSILFDFFSILRQD